MLSLTLIKNIKQWNHHCKLINKRVEPVDPFPVHDPVIPHEYPLLAYSYLIAHGNKYQVKHVLVFKEQASKLLSVKSIRKSSIK